MIKKFTTILGIAVLLAIGTVAQAQTNNTPTTNTPLPVITSNSTLSSLVDLSATNWVVIPFASYDLTTKNFGGGVAALYAVNPNFWAGVRAQSLNGQKAEAGVQAQLQVTTHILGITAIPFLETSVGIGTSALYGSVGPGFLVNIHTWTFNNGKDTLSVGAAADYEHYVEGSRNGNELNVGPSLHFSFP